MASGARPKTERIFLQNAGTFTTSSESEHEEEEVCKLEDLINATKSPDSHNDTRFSMPLELPSLEQQNNTMKRLVNFESPKNTRPYSHKRDLPKSFFDSA